MMHIRSAVKKYKIIEFHVSDAMEKIKTIFIIQQHKPQEKYVFQIIRSICNIIYVYNVFTENRFFFAPCGRAKQTEESRGYDIALCQCGPNRCPRATGGPQMLFFAFLR